jgi:small subunit ribosomal protein S13
MFSYKQVILQVSLEIRSALQHIYGIGKHKAFLICSKLGLSFPFVLKNLNNYYFMMLTFILDFHSWLEARIKRIYYYNIKVLIETLTHRGLRHKDNLPTRGQRTRTNAKTRKKRSKFVYNE